MPSGQSTSRPPHRSHRCGWHSPAEPGPAPFRPSAVREGTCVDIATGAPLPDGADAVVMVERTHRDGDRVQFTRPVAAREHVSPRANDVRAGAVVLRAGDVLTPARLGVAASFGLRSLVVRRKPVVAVISSGDELLDGATDAGAPEPGQIYDANRVMLATVCAASGADVRMLPLVRDTLDHWRNAFDAATHADLIVCSGGSSVGEQDFGGDILAERGEMLFHGIAVKPGKPTALARIGAQLVLAMPGNPTSCLSNAYVLLAPAGPPPRRPADARAGHPGRVARTRPVVARRSAAVPPRAPRRRSRGAGVQGLGRRDEPVGCRRLRRSARRCHDDSKPAAASSSRCIEGEV